MKIHCRLQEGILCSDEILKGEISRGIDMEPIVVLISQVIRSTTNWLT